MSDHAFAHVGADTISLTYTPADLHSPDYRNEPLEERRH